KRAPSADAVLRPDGLRSARAHPSDQARIHRPSSTPVAQQPLLFPLPVAFLFRRALIRRLLAERQPDFELGDAALVKVKLQRRDRIAFTINSLRQSCNLAGVEQKLAGA